MKVTETNLVSTTEGPPSDNIERLRIILEHEQARPIPYDEVSEIGDSLLHFFKILAEAGQQEDELWAA